MTPIAGAQEEQEDQTPNLISAQDVTVEATAEVNLDEQVSPQDLEIKDPKLLPDSPFYFLKEWGRKIRLTFTFNKVKKVGLESKYSNEKLVELEKLIAKGADPEKIKAALENYQTQVDKIKTRIEQIKQTAAENEDVNKFLDKFIKQQILQENILEKLESQVPAEVFEKIKAAREEHLKKFGEIMTKLEERPEKIREKIENALKDTDGSQFKNFKNLEVLKNLEDKVPEKAKEAIQKAQENALKRLQGDLEKMSPEDQEKFKDYINKILGDKEEQAKILEDIISAAKEKPTLQQKLIEAREKILEKVERKNEQKNCPSIEKPAADFCVKGRIIPKKDDNGCITEFKCVIPAEVEAKCQAVCKNIGTASEGWYNSCTGSLLKGGKCGTEPEEKPQITKVCIELWNPVCGKDGKTYSNKCFALSSGTQVAYAGECKEIEIECKTDADCPPLLKCNSGEKCLGSVLYKCVEEKCVPVAATQ